MGKMGSRCHAFLVLSVLALVVVFAQACSDNKGPAGPTFGAGQTGTADTVAQIVVQVAINPNTIELGRRAGITVLVTNTNGRPLEGRHVQLSTNVGSLDVVDGFTDAAGKFVSAIRITEQDAANAAGLVQATVTAFVEGAIGTGTVNFGTGTLLTINPTAINLGTLVNVGGVCTATRSFTISGGIPPYDVSVQAPGASATGSQYRITANIGPIADTIRVVDSAGAVVTAVVTGTCS
jgi:hypothetical protein